jgi:hypothetical protein
MAGLPFPGGGAPAIQMANPWGQVAQAASQFGPAHEQFLQQKAQTADMQMTVNLKKLTMLQQMLKTAPASEDGDPKLISTFRDLLGSIGMTLPMKGNMLDREALGIHAPWQDLLSSDSATYNYFSALDGGKKGDVGTQRDNWLIAHNIDPASLPDSIRYAPAYQVTSPAEATTMFDKAQASIEDLAKGIGDPTNIQNDLLHLALPVDRILGPGTMESLASKLSAQIGPWVSAKIAQAYNTGQLDNSKIQEIGARIKNLDSITNLDKKKAAAQDIINEYLPQTTMSRIASNYARVSEASAAVTRANSYADQVQSNITMASRMVPNSKPWLAAVKSLDSETANLTKAQTDARNKMYALGNLANPTAQDTAHLAVARQTVADLGTRIHSLQVQGDTLRSGSGVPTAPALPDTSSFSRQNPPEDLQQGTHDGHTYTWDPHATAPDGSQGAWTP